MWSKQFRRHYRLSDVHFDCLVSVTQSANAIHAISPATETEGNMIRTILCEISLYPFMNRKEKCGTNFLLSAHAIPAERQFVLIIIASHAFPPLPFLSSLVSLAISLCFSCNFDHVEINVGYGFEWTQIEIFRLVSRIYYKQYAIIDIE